MAAAALKVAQRISRLILDLSVHAILFHPRGLLRGTELKRKLAGEMHPESDSQPFAEFARCHAGMLDRRRKGGSLKCGATRHLATVVVVASESRRTDIRTPNCSHCQVAKGAGLYEFSFDELFGKHC